MFSLKCLVNTILYSVIYLKKRKKYIFSCEIMLCCVNVSSVKVNVNLKITFFKIKFEKFRMGEKKLMYF